MYNLMDSIRDNVTNSHTFKFFYSKDSKYRVAAVAARQEVKMEYLKVGDDNSWSNCKYIDKIVQNLKELGYTDECPEIKGLKFVRDNIQNGRGFYNFEVESVEKSGEFVEWREKNGLEWGVLEEFLTEEIKPGDKFMKIASRVEDEEFGPVNKSELYKFENGEYKAQPCYVVYELPKYYEYTGNTRKEDAINVTRAIKARKNERNKGKAPIFIKGNNCGQNM